MSVRFLKLTLSLIIPIAFIDTFVTANPVITDESSFPTSSLYIDRTDVKLDKNSIKTNALGGRNWVYMREPSAIYFYKSPTYSRDGNNSGLKIGYRKKNEGWCGFYSILHTEKEAYTDVSAYQYLTLWVRGEKGGENFKIGASDEFLNNHQLTLRSAPISNYLPYGEVTTDWQLAVIPMDDFFVNWKHLHSLTVSFDDDLFADGEGEGIVYIDDLAFTKEDDPMIKEQNSNVIEYVKEEEAIWDIEIIPEILYIDRMEDNATDKNSLGNYNSYYKMPPSIASYSKSREYGVDRGENNAALKIEYDKKGTGGPYGTGGWCGFYTITKDHARNKYLDVSQHNYLTFWVKGETGDESFKVGLTARMRKIIQDSIKSKEIGEYLPAGKITTEWQLAVIPIEELWLEWSHLYSISICFEEDIFQQGTKSRIGSVYIDDIAFVTEGVLASIQNQ